MKNNNNNKRRPSVKLSGRDGNAFAIMARVEKALRKAGYSADETDEYLKDATSGSYEHLLSVTMKWVKVK